MPNNPVANGPELKTNYDRIRRMSPLEMANWLYGMRTLCDCCAKHYICGIPEDEVSEEYCLENVILWLGQKETIENGTRQENGLPPAPLA